MIVLNKNLESYQKNSSLTNGKYVKIAYKILIEAIESAIQAIDNGEFDKSSKALILAQNTVYELNQALHMNRNPELGDRIRECYDYLFRTLLTANLKKEKTLIKKSLDVANELFDYWDAVMEKEGGKADTVEPNPHKLTTYAGRGSIKKKTGHYEKKSILKKNKLDIKQ